MKRHLLLLIFVLCAFFGHSQTTIDWKGITWDVMYGTATVNSSDELVLTADATGRAWVHVNQIAALAGATTPWIELSYMDSGNSSHLIDMLMEDEDGNNYPRFAVGSLWSAGRVMAIRRLSLPTYETYLYFEEARQNIEHTVKVAKRVTGTLDVDFDGIDRSSTYLTQFSGGTWEYGDVYLRLRGAAQGETVTFTDFSYGTTHANQTPTDFIVSYDDQGTAMSINTAVQESAAGDVINVSAGTYLGHVTINKSLIMKGTQFGVDANGRTGSESLIQGSFSIVSPATDVTIDGFSFIANSGANELGIGGPYHVAVYGTTNTAQVKNNIFNPAANTNGPFTEGSMVKLTGTSLTVQNNVITQHILASDPLALLITANGNALVNNNTTMAAIGVGTGTGATVEISANFVNDAWNEGIWFWPVASDAALTITGNVVADYNASLGNAKALKVVSKPATINGETQTLNMLADLDTDNPGIDSFLLQWMGPVHNTTQDLFYSTIQPAIDGATAGDVIEVAAGNYLHTTSINVYKSLTIKGVSRTETVIQGDYGTNLWWYLFNVTAVSDVTIKDMTITAINGELIGSYTYGYLIGKTGDVYTPTNNLTIDNVLFPAGRRAVFAKGNNLWIKNCLFTGNWQRANIELGGGSFLIENNDFEARHYQYGALIMNGTDEISGVFQNNTVRSNAIEGWFKTSGSVFAIELYNDNLGINGISFFNNIFVGDYYDPGLNQSGNPMLNRPLYVEYYLKNFNPALLSFTNNTVSGYVSGIFVPLTSTVSNNVFSDQSSNHIRYDLQGESSATVIVAKIESDLANNAFDKGAYNGGPGIESFPGIWTTINNAIGQSTAYDVIKVIPGIYSEQISIDRALTLDGVDGAILDGTGLGNIVGVNIESGDVTFNNIDVLNFGGNGIICGYEATPPGDLQNIHITNCTIANIQPGSSHGFGIYVGYESEGFWPGGVLDGQDHLDYTGLVISGNEIYNTANAAIVLQSISGTTASPLLVSGNTIYDSDASGVWFDCAREINVSGNEIHTSSNGIFLSAYGEDTGYGWFVEDGIYGPKNIDITGNEIYSNSSAGIAFYAGWPSTILVNDNEIYGNTTWGINSYVTTAALDATCNYWGTVDAAVVPTLVDGNVTYEPWSDDLMICGYVAFSNIQNTSTGDYFEDIQSAILAADLGDVIEVTGTHNVKDIVVNKGLKIAAGNGGARFTGLAGREETVGFLVDITSGTEPFILGDDVNELIIEGWDAGVRVASTNTVDVIIEGVIFQDNGIAVDNLTTAIVDAENNYWGAPNGPYDGSDDRSTGGLWNPLGQGDAVSDYVDYQPWYNDADLDYSPIDIAVDNPTCGILEVKIKANQDIDDVLSGLIFAVAWDNTAYTNSVTVVSAEYGITPQYHNNNGTTRYALFGSNQNVDVDLIAGTEYTILTLQLDESGAKFATSDFEILQGAWAYDANEAYYFELFAGGDQTGYVYDFADDVYVSSCDLELDAKVFLQGPYNTATNLMNTDISTLATFPLTQPYDDAPFNCTATTSITSVPTDAVDWVLVGLRANAAGPDDFRVAGLLYKDGTIRGVDGNLISVEDEDLFPNTPYYAVVYHRNHMPVMSASPINIPNTSTFDFTDNWNKGYTPDSEHPLVTLETGVYGMIAGDHYGANWNGSGWDPFDYPDGWLYYTGAQNERDPILAKITSYPGNGPYINGVINNEYYKEDLSMNKQVRYSGAGNDPRLIIQNLIELKNSTSLNAFYESKVPGWAVPHVKKEGLISSPGPLDIALYDTPRELLINLKANELFENGLVSNIQFTLCWEKGDMDIEQMISTYQSTFLLEPQGKPIEVNGKMYLAFATVEPIALPNPLNIDGEVTVMKFTKADENVAIGDAISIANDAWTMANNGRYYISVWGVNKTGQILTNALGIDQPDDAAAVIHVYPNPVAQGWIYLTMKPTATEKLRVNLTDLSGRTVYQGEWNVTAGMANATTIDLTGLSQGAYLLQISGTTNNVTEKIIVR